MNQERQADNQKYANILGSLFHLSDLVYSSYLDYEKAFDIYTFKEVSGSRARNNSNVSNLYLFI